MASGSALVAFFLGWNAWMSLQIIDGREKNVVSQVSLESAKADIVGTQTDIETLRGGIIDVRNNIQWISQTLYEIARKEDRYILPPPPLGNLASTTRVSDNPRLP